SARPRRSTPATGAARRDGPGSGRPPRPCAGSRTADTRSSGVHITSADRGIPHELGNQHRDATSKHNVTGRKLLAIALVGTALVGCSATTPVPSGSPVAKPAFSSWTVGAQPLPVQAD